MVQKHLNKYTGYLNKRKMSLILRQFTYYAFLEGVEVCLNYFRILLWILDLVFYRNIINLEYPLSLVMMSKNAAIILHFLYSKEKKNGSS